MEPGPSSEALKLWTALPAAAQVALHYLWELGTEEDQQLAYRQVARALLQAQRSLHTERLSAELRGQFPGLDATITDDELLDEADRLLEPPPGSPRNGVR